MIHKAREAAFLRRINARILPNAPDVIVIKCARAPSSLAHIRDRASNDLPSVLEDHIRRTNRIDRKDTPALHVRAAKAHAHLRVQCSSLVSAVGPDAALPHRNALLATAHFDRLGALFHRRDFIIGICSHAIRLRSIDPIRARRSRAR